MSLIKELVNSAISQKINSNLTILETKLKRIGDAKSFLLKEGVLDDLPDDIGLAYDEALKRLEAAKRAVSLLKKLPAGQSKTLHTRRIWANMNKISGLIRRIQKSLTTEVSDEEFNSDENDQAGQSQRPVSNFR